MNSLPSSPNAPTDAADTAARGSTWTTRPLLPSSWRRLPAFWYALLPALTIAAACVMQGWPSLHSPPPPRLPHLDRLIPATLTGWEVRDVPLGPSEFLAAEVGRILNFDEAVYREYRRGNQLVAAYAAYWGPGRMPAQVVASHTPDRCWTENGWRCTDLKFQLELKHAGQLLQPAEWRVFEPPGGGPVTYVLYWHLVEGEPYAFGERFSAAPKITEWLRMAAVQMLTGNREQYFIRLSSTVPFDEVWDDTVMTELLTGLQNVGLRQP